MLNLQYVSGGSTKDRRRPSAAQRIVLGVCMVAAPWMFERLRRRALSQGWLSEPPDSRRWRLWRALMRFEAAMKVAHLANLLAFLGGRRLYPTVSDSVAGMGLVTAPSSGGARRGDGGEEGRHAFRNLNFQFMNRELLWDSVTRCEESRVDR